MVAANIQLQIYNGALRVLKQEQLASLSENVEARYYLDGVWDNNGIRYCLEQGLWYFAKRTAKFDADPSVKTNFGYANAFLKPLDWVRTMMLCQDENFNVPLTTVNDEAGYWYCPLTSIYVAYVSDDPDYGNNTDLWPESFMQFVQAYFADEIAPKLTTSKEDMERTAKNEKDKLLKAKSLVAMNEAAAFPPVGSWVRARYGRNTTWLDRGNRGNLIG